ncbi:MAG: methyltransferase [Clostridiales bacterium]|nr:methyltransferase [Clostridiales bacterium]
MIDLRKLNKDLLLPHIKPGGVVCDFTMGNGHDTAWLSKAVGEQGKVYAFDVQQAAIESTKITLAKEGAFPNCVLIHDSHANALQYVHEKICAGVFNLGYLPGSDKKITTKRESTLTAVTTAVSMLDNDGIVFIAVYPGHEEGRLEGQLLEKTLSAKYDRKEYCVSSFKIINSPDSPYFLIIEKK